MSFTEKIRKHIWPWCIFILAAAVFYIWIAYQIPYTHDDWDWGLAPGIEHLTTADINSRYAGNAVEVLITRSFALKTVVMGLVFALMVFSSTKNAYLFLSGETKSKIDFKTTTCAFLFANCIFLCMPSYIWGQTNGWVAGFANFVMSALAMLIFFRLLFERGSSHLSKKRKVTSAVLHFVFGVIIQLFIENLTVIFLMFSFAFALYCLIRKEERKNINIYTLFAGNLAGAVIMFSNNIYSSLWNTGTAVDGYRVLQYDRSKPLSVFLETAYQRYMRNFIPGIVSQDILIPMVISLLLLLIAARKLKGKESFAKKFLIVLMMIFDIAFLVYYGSVMFNKCPAFIRESDSLYAFIDLGFAEIISVELVVLFLNERKLLRRLLVFWFMPFLAMVPMLTVDSIGGRCFYAGVISFCVFCQMLLIYYLKNVRFVPKTIVLVVLGIITAFFAFSMGRIYLAIGHVSRERYQIIENVKDETGDITIVMPPYPFEDYMWFPDPADDSRVAYFKEFYGIPDNVDVEF